MSWTSTQVHDLKLQMILWEETNKNTNPKGKTIARPKVENIKNSQTPRKGTKQTKFYKKIGSKKHNGTIGVPQTPIISRDEKDGNFPNYCQSIQGDLVRSATGYPLCNYRGLSSHKRQYCFIKTQDRLQGVNRQDHPDKSSNIFSAQNKLPWHQLLRSNY